ncbi:NAD+ kinase [Aureibacillus halotolerans]|uniref:NAD kinase n=1 Tax=Aureibacillus halotolerans TaxID=1508390 RepID=A0A4R6U2Y2_9BACI|nr:NAD+ kinase [Aureibacillus halotolerans]
MLTDQSIYFSFKKTPELTERIEKIQKAADAYGFTLEKDYKKADIIVSMGDDGSFLQAVRKTKFREDCTYVGISTDAQPRLYCDFSVTDPDTIKKAVETNESIEVRRYPTLEVSVNGMSPLYCLNECSIRSSIIKTFVMDVYIDDLHFETFRGDGLVVSTPTGSTAYNKSINGAVVDPLLPCFQVSELASLNNNRYRTLGSSFILSNQRKLRLRIHEDGNDYPVIGLDNEAMSIQNIRTIDIALSHRTIKTVKLKNNSFWEKVKRSFLEN